MKIHDDILKLNELKQVNGRAIITLKAALRSIETQYQVLLEAGAIHYDDYNVPGDIDYITAIIDKSAHLVLHGVSRETAIKYALAKYVHHMYLYKKHQSYEQYMYVIHAFLHLRCYVSDAVAKYKKYN